MFFVTIIANLDISFHIWHMFMTYIYIYICVCVCVFVCVCVCIDVLSQPSKDDVCGMSCRYPWCQSRVIGIVLIQSPARRVDTGLSWTVIGTQHDRPLLGPRVPINIHDQWNRKRQIILLYFIDHFVNTITDPCSFRGRQAFTYDLFNYTSQISCTELRCVEPSVMSKSVWTPMNEPSMWFARAIRLEQN